MVHQPQPAPICSSLPLWSGRRGLADRQRLAAQRGRRTARPFEWRAFVFASSVLFFQDMRPAAADASCCRPQVASHGDEAGSSGPQTRRAATEAGKPHAPPHLRLTEWQFQASAIRARFANNRAVEDETEISLGPPAATARVPGAGRPRFTRTRGLDVGGVSPMLPILLARRFGRSATRSPRRFCHGNAQKLTQLFDISMRPYSGNLPSEGCGLRKSHGSH